MLIDKKILGGGIALLVVGFALTATFTSVSPVGREGMTDDEIAAFAARLEESFISVTPKVNRRKVNINTKDVFS